MRKVQLEMRKDRRGQAMVEFALLAPILMLIVLGIIEFGRVWYAYQTITDTTREATRTSVIFNSAVTQDSVIRLIQFKLALAGLDSTKATVQITPPLPPGGAHTTDAPRAVRIDYAYHLGWLQPMLNWTNNQAGISLKTTNIMRQE